MKQARSRLKKDFSSQQPIKNSRQAIKPKVSRNETIQNYLQLIPTLTMAMLCYFGLWLLIKFIYPSSIQNWIFPNSYLPFHLLFGLGNFFLFSFISRRKIWGFMVSVLIGWLVFLKLQQIEIDFWAISSSFILAITASFWWMILQFFNKNK